MPCIHMMVWIKNCVVKLARYSWRLLLLCAPCQYVNSCGVIISQYIEAELWHIHCLSLSLSWWKWCGQIERNIIVAVEWPWNIHLVYTCILFHIRSISLFELQRYLNRPGEREKFFRISAEMLLQRGILKFGTNPTLHPTRSPAVLWKGIWISCFMSQIFCGTESHN